MSSGIYQTTKDEIATIRLILQISYERRNQLVNINNQFIGIVSAIIIGIISFLGTAYFTSADPTRFYAIILAIHLIIITLIFWRFYAHIIDDDIAKSYKNILFCENKLNIPLELGLLSALEKSLKLTDYPDYCKQDSETKMDVIKELIDRNRIGYRYHKLLDFIALGICIIAYSSLILFISVSQPSLSDFDFFSYVIVIPIGYLIFLIGLMVDIFPIIPIQREPSADDIISVLFSIGIRS